MYLGPQNRSNLNAYICIFILFYFILYGAKLPEACLLVNNALQVTASNLVMKLS